MNKRWPMLSELLRLSFRADRRAAWIILINFTIRPVSTVIMSIALAAMAAAAVEGQQTAAVIALVVACLMLGVQVILGRYSLAVSAALVDRTNRLVDSEMQGMLYRARTIMHFHDRQVLQDLQVIRSEQARLTEGADVIGLIVGTTLRLALTIVVAALASLWLLLVPLASVAAFLCARARDRAVGEGIAASAAPARRSAELARIGTSPAYVTELLLSRGRRFLLEEHRSSAMQAEAARGRGLWQGFGWMAAGLLWMVSALAVGITGLIRSVSDGQTSLASALAALLLLSSTTALMSALIRYLSSCADSLRVTALLARVTDTLDRDGDATGAARPSEDGTIRLNSVTYRYPGSASAAVDNVTLQLNAGSVYAIVGANGSGKTTLVHLIAGLLTPTQGRVQVGDVDRVDLSIHDQYAPTSLVAQDFSKLEFHLEDAVRLGDTTRTTQQVQEALAEARLDNDRHTGGLNLQTPLGESMSGGRLLSGGQWQRVALARGLLRNNATLVLFDEPTSAIDPFAEDELLNSFVIRARHTATGVGGVTVIVSHRMSLARDVDAVVLMDGGKVRAVGAHDELLRDDLYHSLYDAQRRGYASTVRDTGEEGAKP